MKDFFLIAEITALSGSSGFVKVRLYSNFPVQFNGLEKVFIDFWGSKKEFYIENIKQAGNSFKLKFNNFDDDRDAGVLLGRELFVAKKDLAKLEKNGLYLHDFIGCKVLKVGKQIGIVKEILALPANNVIVIKRDDEKEILIPLVLEFIEKFDPENKTLILKKEFDYDDED